MVNFFFVTMISLFLLLVIGVILFLSLTIYVFDSVSIVISDSFLQDWRDPLRQFLNIVVDPIFDAVIIGMIIIVFLGLFSKRLRPHIEENMYRLKNSPLKSKKVTVVLTAYNEAEVIGNAVREFVSNKLVDRVIVIDNGSKDATSEIAQKEGSEIIRVEKNQGYGYACLRGLQESLKTDSNIIILCEGDNTFSGNDVEKFLAYIENADMVVGTRTVRALTKKDTQMSQFYVWGNYFIAFLIQLKYFDPTDITHVRLTDVGCTYRAIKKDALKIIIDKLDAKGHLFSPHMILVAIENNLTTIEIPITFRQRKGMSKGAGGKKSLGFKVGIQMIWEIMTR